MISHIQVYPREWAKYNRSLLQFEYCHFYTTLIDFGYYTLLCPFRIRRGKNGDNFLHTWAPQQVKS